MPYLHHHPKISLLRIGIRPNPQRLTTNLRGVTDHMSPSLKGQSLIFASSCPKRNERELLKKEVKESLLNSTRPYVWKT